MSRLHPPFSQLIALLLISLILPTQTACSQAADTVTAPEQQTSPAWPRFRGPDGSGIVETFTLPDTWDTSAYRWDITLPGVGHSSPVIAGDNVFVTTAVDEGQKRMLLCLDRTTGKTLWSSDIALSSNHLHRKNSWASSSPATNGKIICVTFADDDHHVVQAFDTVGTKLWSVDLGSYLSQHGYGASPIIYNDLVIITHDQRRAEENTPAGEGPNDSFIVALDLTTGDEMWRTERPSQVASYATPLVLSRSGQETQLICSSDATGVAGIDPSNGKTLWQTGPLKWRTVGSPVLCGDLIVQACGAGGAGKYFFAVDPWGLEDRKAGEIVFEMNRTIPYVPIPVYRDGLIFLLLDQGLVRCLDAKTFEEVWLERIPGAKFTGSPISVSGRLCALSEDGKLHIMKAGREYDYLGAVSIGEASHSTPAASHGELFLRTFERLICLPGVTPQD
ncbi:outer membrane protein assembly factor BamB family protein [Calycomorphotria hydatis]|uniref:outer membrane protein assembly factor BamB family protein n=1 Tax=Calycomorphotria hydatis TaxID=2528027 RepID=UPI0018D1FCE0|nr:PQQ-binding-like beta-propeller repeat protein [Calycomorphotria hydatis]